MEVPAYDSSEKTNWLDELPENGISQADFLRVRNTLVQILEEVKLRRTTDVENEEIIKHLVKEKHQLECKYDTELSRGTTLQQKHEEEVRQIHRQYADKVRQMQEEKSRQQILEETNQKETKSLKDDVRNVQLQKYSLEKQLHEQGSKLHLQMANAEKYLLQLSSLEKKFKAVIRQHQTVVSSQERLEKNVSESMRLNRTLTYVNHHQKCLVEQYARNLEISKQELLEARVEIQCKPAETSQIQKDLQRKVEQLEVMVKQKDETFELKNREFQTVESHYEKSQEQLQESHKLLEGHLAVAKQYRQECKDLTSKVESLETEQKELKTNLEEKETSLENVNERHLLAEKEWKSLGNEIKNSLTKTETDLREAIESRDKLERLNTDWAKKNLHISEEINKLQAVINVNKTDNWSQVETAFSTSSMQTDIVNIQTRDTQVPPIVTTISSSQTPVTLTSASGSQTDEVTSRTFGTHDHLCCNNANSKLQNEENLHFQKSKPFTESITRETPTDNLDQKSSVNDSKNDDKKIKSLMNTNDPSKVKEIESGNGDSQSADTVSQNTLTKTDASKVTGEAGSKSFRNIIDEAVSPATKAIPETSNLKISLRKNDSDEGSSVAKPLPPPPDPDSTVKSTSNPMSSQKETFAKPTKQVQDPIKGDCIEEGSVVCSQEKEQIKSLPTELRIKTGIFKTNIDQVAPSAVCNSKEYPLISSLKSKPMQITEKNFGPKVIAKEPLEIDIHSRTTLNTTSLKNSQLNLKSPKSSVNKSVLLASPRHSPAAKHPKLSPESTIHSSVINVPSSPSPGLSSFEHTPMQQSPKLITTKLSRDSSVGKYVGDLRTKSLPFNNSKGSPESSYLSRYKSFGSGNKSPAQSRFSLSKDSSRFIGDTSTSSSKALRGSNERPSSDSQGQPSPKLPRTCQLGAGQPFSPGASPRRTYQCIAKVTKHSPRASSKPSLSGGTVSKDISSPSHRKSPGRTNDDESDSQELSPYSRFSSQLRTSSQEHRSMSHLSQIQNFDVPSTPRSQNEATRETGCYDGTSQQETPVVSAAPRGILKVEIYSTEKKVGKSVHFGGVFASSPPKPYQTDGEVPLFSDTEDEPIELGSQIKTIQAILNTDNTPKTGSSRKRKGQP